MQFNVSDLLRESYGAFREFSIDDDIRIDGELHHLAGNVRFDRVPLGIFVRATLLGDTAAECSRCLDAFRQPVALTIEEQYIPTIDLINGGRVTPPEGEEDAYRIDERHMIDLLVPVRQYWGMALPIAPVCSQACAGICESCGQRREPDHACTSEADDGRWAKLRDLKLG